MTDAAESIARIDKALATGRGAYLTAEQVQELADLIRGLVKARHQALGPKLSTTVSTPSNTVRAVA